MTTYNWKIANFERETATGKVTVVHYTIDATDGTYNAGAYGSIGLDGEVVTPYGQLTEAYCVGWVKAALGAEKVAEVEAALQAQIDEQAAPSKAAGVPWQMAWADVVDGTAPSNDFRWTTTDPEFIALKLGDRIKATDPANAIPVGATCLEKREDGVSVWDMPTTLSGSNVPFRVAIDHCGPDLVPELLPSI